MKRSVFRTPHSALRTCRGFTLVEIMVAMGVFVILGTALVGLMSAAMETWRRGEAGRQANEKLQTLKRQIADDLAAAVLDPPPPADFHFVLDTLHDLAGNPSIAVDPSSELKDPQSPAPTDGRELTYFGGSGTVILRIRVPFVIRAALLQARTDVLGPTSTALVSVGRNNPAAISPADPNAPDDSSWKLFANLTTEGMGGGETDVTDAVQGGNIVFIKAVLTGQAQFLRTDAMRVGGRPVLILDCYRDPNALAQQPRPTFAAWVKDGAQIITFTRTLPPEMESAAAKTGQFTGRAQVAYRIQPYHSSLGKPGLGVLRRAYVTPLPSDFTGPKVAGRLRPNIIGLIEDIIDPAKTPGADQAFIPNVLHLSMSFWGADTTTWEDRADLEPGYATKYNGTTSPYPRPASREWLSSRYLPEQVQVTVVLEPDRGKRVTTALAQSIGPDDFPAASPGILSVMNTQGFDAVERPSAAFVRDPRHFLKIGDEWVFYAGVRSATEFAIPRQGSDGFSARGARGSLRATHGAGAEVSRGIPAVFTVSGASHSGSTRARTTLLRPS